MKMFTLSLIAAAVAAVSAQAQLITNNYAGNGNTGFGGAVGNGSLQIVNDNLGNLNFTFTRGPSDLNNAVVLYLNTISGGASNTSLFSDTADGLRAAISGLDGGNTNNRSTLNFVSGFGADFAIAFNATTNISTPGFGGLWSLSNNTNFPFVVSANLSPGAPQTNASYSFGINVTNIGLTANSGQTFSFFATYVSLTGFRSGETFGASFTGSPASGWNTFDAAGSNTFTTVPEPSTYALLALSALGLAGYAARRRART